MSGYTIVNLLEIDDDVEGRSPASRGASVASTSTPAIWASATGATPRTPATTEATATASRRRPTSSSRARAASASTTSCATSALGRHPREPEVVRAFEAGPDGLELIAVGGPKPEGGDGVRAETPWPDGDDQPATGVKS